MLIVDNAAFLVGLEERGVRLFFSHDPSFALGKVARDDRGRFHTVDELPALRGLAA